MSSLIDRHYHDDRILASSSDNPLDYSVLAVFVMTLGLILVVELFRHRMDVSATGRPFFKTVLEGVYRELATLGIVEFVIFILHKYYDDLNLQQEQVFADVHFTLFYTALFNAFQSVLLAVCVSRVSNSLWVQTEQLELDHYVEIREEFDRIHALLYADEVNEKKTRQQLERSADDMQGDDDVNHAWNDQNNNKNNTQQQVHASHQSSLWSSYYDSTINWNICSSCRSFGKKLARSILFPHLVRKHNALLIQVRFHELRVHFLRSNNLPLKLRVSDYLKRSELHVLTKLVHITTFAWLLLLGGVNLIYFLLGISITITSNGHTAGVAMRAIFMGLNIFFVLVSLVIYDKMKRVFDKIMHMKLTAPTTNAEEQDIKIGATILSSSEREVTSQLALFWGNDPRYVTSLIQFMQFGFAIALAILLVFWDDIHSDSTGTMDERWLLLVVFACYAAFVAIMAHVIPRFTLCTSLGQLVNHRRLHETLARFRLEEAHRKRLEAMEEITLGDSFDWEEEEEIGASNDEDDEGGVESSSSSPDETSYGGSSGPLSSMRKALKSSVLGKPPPPPPRKPPPRKLGSKTTDDIERQKSAHFSLMADLVGGDTNGLRNTLQEKRPERLAANGRGRDERTRERRLMRKKAVSEGVASMRTMSSPQNVASVNGGQRSFDQRDSLTTIASSGSSDTVDSPIDMRARRRQRRKAQSESASIQMMRDMTMKPASLVRRGLDPLPEGRPHSRTAVDNPDLLAELVMTDTKQLRDNLNLVEHERFSFRDDQMPFSREDRMRERRKRRKSVSDGVTLMRQVGMSEAASEVLDASSDRVENPTFPVPAARASYHERRKSLSDSARMRRMREGSVSPAGSRSMSRAASKERLGESAAGEIDRARRPPESEPSPTEAQKPGNVVTFKEDEQADSDVRSSLNHFPSNMSDDGHSDADDVPDFDQSFKERLQAEPEPQPTLKEMAQEYFLSRKYQMISAIFGTTIIFFFISMRVEDFLLETCTLPDNRNTMDLNLNVLFWCETAFLCAFMFGSALSIFLFAPEQHCNFRYRTRVVAAVFDIVLSVACLALLMIAESQRCCSKEGARLLAEEGEKAPSYCTPNEDCCPMFGSRSYGGLGNIEPFTSLIALRIVRFYVSKKVVTFCSPRLGMTTAAPSEGQTERLHNNPVHPTYDRKEHVDKTKSMEDERGTVVELWKHALGIYPDIVEKYGEFSAELLQVMLGIEIMEQKAKSAAPDNIEEPLSPAVSDQEIPPPAPSPKRKERFKVDRRYSDLSPDVQCIILSGKLGRSVKSLRNLEVSEGASPCGSPTIGVKTTGLQPLVEGKTVEEFKDRAAPAFEFGIDEVVQSTTDPLSSLVAPNARLIRSMRRCDRRLPPLLDEWTVVDVVITKHEIVYFDANNLDDFQHSDRSPDEIAKIETVYQALAATRGGKGLRLRDVAGGRKIVGHLALSSIENINVERVTPRVVAVEEEQDIEASENLTEAHDEFWKPSYVASRAPRSQRWQRLKEDRLKIRSRCETLYLRFYSDLEDSEANRERCLNEREEDGPIFKNNALQWCQTIVRLSGADQLKQSFPHYGDDSSDELRDYLVVVSAEDADKNPGVMTVLKKLHHRRASSANLAALALDTTVETPAAAIATAGMVATALAKPPKNHRRSSTTISGLEEIPERKKASFLHRSSSTGDLGSKAGSVEGLDVV